MAGATRQQIASRALGVVPQQTPPGVRGDGDHLRAHELEIAFDETVAQRVRPTVEESLESRAVVVDDEMDDLGPEAAEHRVGDEAQRIRVPARVDGVSHRRLGVDLVADEARIDREGLRAGVRMDRSRLELAAQPLERGTDLGVLLAAELVVLDADAGQDRARVPEVLDGGAR